MQAQAAGSTKAPPGQLRLALQTHFESCITLSWLEQVQAQVTGSCPDSSGQEFVQPHAQVEVVLYLLSLAGRIRGIADALGTVVVLARGTAALAIGDHKRSRAKASAVRLVLQKVFAAGFAAFAFAVDALFISWAGAVITERRTRWLYRRRSCNYEVGNPSGPAAFTSKNALTRRIAAVRYSS